MLNIVKNTTLPGLFSLLAPHSCRGCGTLGKPLCDRCKNYIIKNHQNFCPSCHASNPSGKCPDCPDLPPTHVVGSRADLIGELIHDFKYNSTRALARPLAEILDATLPNLSNAVIIPLPTISKHVRERGFSHTHLIAKHLSNLRKYPVQPLLIRVKNTVQVGSDASTRKTQAASAYALTKNSTINPDVTYILLDDVWTTGATMQAAYNLLQDAGAKNVIISLLARSE